MWRAALSLVALVVVVSVSGSAAASTPSLQFTVFAHTDLPLGQVRWTGRKFLYVAENTGEIETAGPRGAHSRVFARFTPGGEETRCVQAPAAFWPAGIYCHTPDNRILRIAADGTSATQLAELPGAEPSDGALAFDTSGRFGHALLAATGGSSSDGGQIFAVQANGSVQAVASYAGPGGADELVIAPRQFGSASGRLLVAIDQDGVSGRLVAVDRDGTVTMVATGLDPGVNPIAVVLRSPPSRPASAPAAGFYVADTPSQSVLFAPAQELEAWVGSVLVGTEKTGMFWLIRPRPGGGFAVVPVQSDLPRVAYNLEGATYVP